MTVIQPVSSHTVSSMQPGDTTVTGLVHGGKPSQIILRTERDVLLTDFGKAVLGDRYLLPGECYQSLFARVARAYADDDAHAARLYDYMSKLWFMPATPILSNGDQPGVCRSRVF